MFLSCTCFTQDTLYSISSAYDDSPQEWLIDYSNAIDSFGQASMRVKWVFERNYDEWIIEFGDDYYSIRKINHLPHLQWEIRNASEHVLLRQKWRNDNNIWVIQHGDENITWQTHSTNNFEEWFMEKNQDNFLEMWTRYQFDPRDWDINDYAPDISTEIKMAALFITIYLTLPR